MVPETGVRRIIGFGNALHGDDGFAAEVCRRLAAQTLPVDVRVTDVGGQGLDALTLLENCVELIIVDAATPAGQPGQLAVNDGAAWLGKQPIGGLHRGVVPYFLHAAKALDLLPPQLTLLTAEARSVQMFQPGLSPPLQAAVDKAILWLDQRLSREADAR